MSQKRFAHEIEQWTKRGETQPLEEYRNVSTRDNREKCGSFKTVRSSDFSSGRRANSDEKLSHEGSAAHCSAGSQD